MPSKSLKQARFMRAIAHDPKFAAKVKVPVSVGKEFNMADDAYPVKASGGAYRHASGTFHSNPLEKGYTKP